MSRITLHARFDDEADAPAGDPPQFTVRGHTDRVTVLDGDAGGAPEHADYETHVTITGETTFVEDGVITFGNGDRLRVSTVGEGTLEPSAEPGLLRGSVIWRVDGGEGRFAGASGLVTSNFMFTPERGTATEHQLFELMLD